MVTIAFSRVEDRRAAPAAEPVDKPVDKPADKPVARELGLRPEPSAPQRARDFVAETLSAWRLDDHQEPAALIASELVTNAVHHAGTDLTLRLLRASSHVRIEVADGAGEREPRRVSAADTGGVGGVGLVIVERLAEEWGVDRRRGDKSGNGGNGGKVVWARLAVGPRSAAG